MSSVLTLEIRKIRKRAKKKPSPSSIRVKFRPSAGIQSTRAVTTSPAMIAGRFVSRPIKAAKVTVNVTPAHADRPAGFIKPGRSAPKNGSATIKNRDTDTPEF